MQKTHLKHKRFFNVTWTIVCFGANVISVCNYVSDSDMPMILSLLLHLSTMCNHRVYFPPCLFQPAALVERLSTYKSSVEQVELREKQLAAMRVDVCSSAALKKLKGIPVYSSGFMPLAISQCQKDPKPKFTFRE